MNRDFNQIYISRSLAHFRNGMKERRDLIDYIDASKYNAICQEDKGIKKSEIGTYLYETLPIGKLIYHDFV